jgi:hypothetical protein
MNHKIIAEIWGASLCFWGHFSLYNSFRIRRFIIKRYEQETHLSQTKYFKEWMPWVKHMPPFFKSVMYSSHLWKFAWYWKKNKFETEKKMGKIEIYDDIKGPEQVTRHFSEKEIRRVKRMALLYLCIALHAVAYLVLR